MQLIYPEDPVETMKIKVTFASSGYLKSLHEWNCNMLSQISIFDLLHDERRVEQKIVVLQPACSLTSIQQFNGFATSLET